MPAPLPDSEQRPGSLFPVGDPHWRDQAPLVSICCITYNHEAFIAEAIDGFLMQRTGFPVEILIHDDASTDRTADIVRAYEQRYPWLIRPIYQSENQYSKKVKVAHLNYQRAKGDFFAYCEGDDAWTDPLKLQRQIGQMQAHPECRLSFHPALRIDYARAGRRKTVGHYGDRARIVPPEEIILKRHGQIPTAACVVRRDALDEFRRFTAARAYLTVGDIYMQIISAIPDGALYLPEPMSLYRARTNGSWTARVGSDPRMQLEHAWAVARSLKELDDMTAGRYHDAFVRRTRKYVRGVLRSPRIGATEQAALVAEFGSALGPGDRLAALLRRLFRKWREPRRSVR